MLERAFQSLSGLPAGVRQADCDGPDDFAGDATEEQLWSACDERNQEAIALAFTQKRVEEIRDAVLDARDAAQLGEILWREWNEFRDRAVERLVQFGEISR